MSKHPWSGMWGWFSTEFTVTECSLILQDKLTNSGQPQNWTWAALVCQLSTHTWITFIRQRWQCFTDWLLHSLLISAALHIIAEKSQWTPAGVCCKRYCNQSKWHYHPVISWSISQSLVEHKFHFSEAQWYEPPHGHQPLYLHVITTLTNLTIINVTFNII